jgi:hypothetical protein
MQLKPRLQKQKGNRRTQKRSQQHLPKQRGGADWPTFNGAQGIWEAELQKAKLWDSVGELFADSHPPEKNGKLMRHYLNAVMMQDELMDVALELMRKENDVTDTFDSVTDKIAIIDGKEREEFLKYVIDVQRMCSFKELPSESISGNAKDLSKLEQIRSVKTETNSSLLLFPARLQNIFIAGLATIAIQLKHSTLANIKNSKMDTDTVAKLQAELYTSYIEGYAKMKTGRGLRDGFFLDESTGEFTNYLYRHTFFFNMIKELRKLIKKERDPFNLTCNTYNTGLAATVTATATAATPAADGDDKDFMKLTADILYTYIEGDGKSLDIATILNKFTVGNCEKDTINDVIINHIKSVDEQDYIPNYEGNEALYTGKIEGTEVSYLQLLSHMPSYSLNYMIHLCHTIQKLEPVVKASIEEQAAKAKAATAATPAAGGP